MPSSEIGVEPTGCVVCGLHEGVAEAIGQDYLHSTSPQTYRYWRCAGCDHLYLNPRPVIGEIGRIYPPEYATYTKRFGQSESVLAKIKDKVLLGRFEALAGGLPQDMRLLDVGCGDGRFLLALRRRFPKAALSGLDWFFGPEVTQDLVSARIEPLVGAIESSKLPKDHYDVITMNQLIEHVWDVRQVLQRCKEALKVGGLLALETPNPDGWDRRFFKAGAWGGYYWPRHLNLFTRRHLSRLIEESGMDVVFAQSLLAPPCWIYSCQFFAHRAGVGPWFNKVFADTSTPLLAGFAAIERVALLLGAETSNQKIVARKGA